MAISIRFQRVSVMVLLAGVFAGSFAAPATKAEPPKLAKEKPQPPTDRYGDPLPPGAIARLGTIRWRLPHFGIDRLVVSADGKTLVTVHPQGGISIWDSATGKIVRQIPSDRDPRPEWLSQKRQWGSRAPGASQRSTALSADGRSAAFAAASGDIYIVDIPAGKVRQYCRGHQGIIQETALSADGKVLVSRSEDGTLRIWDVSSGREVRQLPLAKQEWVQHQPAHLALAPNGKTAAWISPEKERPIHVYDISSGEEKHCLREHPGEERGIAFSPRGDLLLATCGKGPDQLWDVQTGRLVRTLPHKPAHYASAAAFTADGSRLALAIAGAGLQLHEVATGKEIWRNASSWGSSEPELLAFAPDGKTLFAKLAKWPGWVLHRYDTRTGAHLAAPDESRGNFDAIAFAPDDRILYTVGGGWVANGDSRMWMWNAGTGDVVRQTAKSYSGACFSPSGRFLAIVDQEGAVRLYEPATEKELWRQRTSAGRHLSAWAFSLDGSSLAIAERGNDPKTGHRIVVRSTANGAEIGRIHDLDQPAEDLLIAPDNHSLAYIIRTPSSRSRECSICFRDLFTGRKLRESIGWFSTAPAAVAFSADGRTAAAPAEHRQGYISIDLQECAAGWRTRLELPPLESIPSPVAFSPDGLLFVIGDPDGAVRVFDAHTGRLLRRQEGHCTGVRSLVFSHDGRKLATTSYDTTALIWDITDLLKSARGKEIELSEAELRSLWGELAAVDAARAYRAIGRLAQGGKPILPWLRKRLLPVPPVDPKRLAQLVTDLDDDRFTVREKATAELTELGELAVPALRKALAGRPSLELRRRAESLLKQAEELSDYKSRILRSVEVVEAIGGTAAVTLLKEWAKGAAEASLGWEAKAALERLARRRHPKP